MAPSYQAPHLDAHTAIDFLTARCVGALERVQLQAHGGTTATKPGSPKPASFKHGSPKPASPKPPSPKSSPGGRPATVARLPKSPVLSVGMPLRPALALCVSEMEDMLHAVVRDATSTSLLVMGQPGVGKTLAVERAVAAVCAHHNRPGERTLGVVRLNGGLHCEERSAFQEIARQLCGEFNQLFSSKASYDENLAFLCAMLASLHTHMKSVVFLLDGFEAFARARGKQQLLYNLFDVLQHSKVQAAVIGITCAQDVMEGMEKRVKSRFSHRKIVITCPSHFEAPVGKQKLAAGQPLLGADSLSPAFAREHNQAVANTLRAPAVKDALRQLFYGPLTPADLVGIAHGALTAWDADLAVWCDQQAQQQAALADGSLLSPRRRPQSALQLTGSPAGKASSRLEAGSPGGGANHRRPGSAAAGVNSPGSHLNSPRRQSPGLRVPHSPGNRSRGAGNRGVAAPAFSAVHVLAAVQQANSSNDLDLSVLQLWLVVGMMRLEAKRQTMYNFEMVWDECQSIRADHGLLSSMTRAAAWRAFEGLLAYGVAFWIDPGVEGRGRALQYAGDTDPTDPNKYRMLAVSSVLYRLYANVLRHVLTAWCMTHKVLPAEQFGFIPGRSTMQPMFILRHLVHAQQASADAKHRKLFTAFIDFKQAYDHIPRQQLWEHLRVGVKLPQPLLACLEGLYRDDSYVLIDGPHRTPPVTPDQGVKQGCPISPLLFALYVHDISKEFLGPIDAVRVQGTPVTHFMYADDLTLVSTCLQGFADRKHLTVNVGKSKVMVFNGNSQTAAPSRGTKAMEVKWLERWGRRWVGFEGDPRLPETVHRERCSYAAWFKHEDGIGINHMAPHLLNRQLTTEVRTSLTRFRLGNSGLGVEKARFEGVTFIDRTCTRCTEGGVDDAMHFIFGCTATSSIREQPEFALTLQNNNENLHDFMLSPCAPLFVHLALKCAAESPEPLEGEGGLAA
ncbi:hypothetical protein QJQ45_000256 [Haematococcus lacustris]|nr:hypothetical protein QJQ45_000256 [Haematococcus lacustris]